MKTIKAYSQVSRLILNITSFLRILILMSVFLAFRFACLNFPRKHPNNKLELNEKKKNKLLKNMPNIQIGWQENATVLLAVYCELPLRRIRWISSNYSLSCRLRVYFYVDIKQGIPWKWRNTLPNWIQNGLSTFTLINCA